MLQNPIRSRRRLLAAALWLGLLTVLLPCSAWAVDEECIFSTLGYIRGKPHCPLRHDSSYKHRSIPLTITAIERLQGLLKQLVPIAIAYAKRQEQ